MLGQWRIVLRQAEESARSGRFDEALALTQRPDVADHRQAIQLRARLVAELVARASRRAGSDDLAGALDDLDLAERSGAAPDVLAAARLGLADSIAEELRIDLDAGEPGRVVERCEALARRKVGGPGLRRLREAAESWQAALTEARKGEFGRATEALDRAERLGGESARGALEAARRDLESRRSTAHPAIERLYAALAEGRWGETLAAAEAALEAVPEHIAARQARTLAWQQIGGLSPVAALPGRNGRLPISADLAPRPTAFRAEPSGPLILRNLPESPRLPRIAEPIMENPAPKGPNGRFLLWADAIGGYLVCLEPEVRLGRAGTDGPADVPLLGDLSSDHASIVRDGDGYLIRARHPTFVNGRKVEGSGFLRDGDVIRLGSTVELSFRLPSPVSATARLEVISRHRLPIAVDGIILMAETCILGPSRQAHIPAPNLDAPIVLYRQGGGLACRAPGGFEVDGKPCLGRSALGPRSSVLGEGFSFSLEPLSSLA